MLPSLARCGALINSCFVLSWVPTQVMCGPSLCICSGCPQVELCSTVCWTMQELLEVGESVLVQQESVWHLVHVQHDKWLQTWDCWAVPSQTMECTHWGKGMIEWPRPGLRIHPLCQTFDKQILSAWTALASSTKMMFQGGRLCQGPEHCSLNVAS